MTTKNEDTQEIDFFIPRFTFIFNSPAESNNIFYNFLHKETGELFYKDNLNLLSFDPRNNLLYDNNYSLVVISRLTGDDGAQIPLSAVYEIVLSTKCFFRGLFKYWLDGLIFRLTDAFNALKN